jgi:hypothetical protein
MKILVAIPVYDGKLPVETARCLFNEQHVAVGGGDDFSVRFLPACSHPAMGRNQLANDFMNSDADRLVFLDSDVTFTPGSLVKIARHPVDFVGGAYRFKLEEESYPVGWLDTPQLWADSHGLLEVATLPGGFLSLSRMVFQVLKAAHPEREYEHFGRTAHCYFQMPFHNGHLYGEDSFFCKEWRDAGGKVLLDPELSLTHWDFNRPFAGHIGNWLKRRAGLATAAETRATAGEQQEATA